jgi:hypothetical protein
MARKLLRANVTGVEASDVPLCTITHGHRLLEIGLKYQIFIAWRGELSREIAGASLQAFA